MATRIFKLADARRLAEEFSDRAQPVHESWHSGGTICITLVSTKPCFLRITPAGDVALQDPRKGTPSSPHLIHLGRVDVSVKKWPSLVANCYKEGWTPPVTPAAVTPAAVTPAAVTPPVVSQPAGVTISGKPFELSDWVQAIGEHGPIAGLEVNQAGDARWMDGRKVTWVDSQGGRLRVADGEEKMALVILRTFRGPPPDGGRGRVKYKNAGAGWKLSNLEWAGTPDRGTRTNERALRRIFELFATGQEAREIADYVSIDRSSVYRILIGDTHSHLDEARRTALAAREAKGIPDTKTCTAMRTRLGG